MEEKALKDVRFARVSDVMTEDVSFIDGSATVADAVRTMRDKRVSSLLVNRRTHEDAWGIVTRKDVVIKVVDPGKEPQDVKVFEIMTKPVFMVTPSLALKYCARLLHHAGVRRAPVFDGKEIVGIVSNTDIFNAIRLYLSRRHQDRVRRPAQEQVRPSQATPNWLRREARQRGAPADVSKNPRERCQTAIRDAVLRPTNN